MSLLPCRNRAAAALLVLAVAVAFSPAARAGRVVNVTNGTGLQNAVLNAQPGDEIVLAAGTYDTRLYLSITDSNVTVRGATGNPADVIVQGMGMNVNPGGNASEGFQIYANDVTIKDLTVQEYYFHAIHFQPNTYRTRILNVITRNNGEQHIKGAKYNYDGLIENTVCEQTYVRTNDGNVSRPDDYIGGIDLHGGVNFVIRNCTVRNIMGAGGDADGSIFAWNTCSNITVENCTVIGGNRGICFGNNSGGSSAYDVDGGIIRNCFVYARTAGSPPPSQPWLSNADCAIDVFACRNVNVYNNTVWTDSGSYGRTVRVGKGVTYSNSNVQFKYNIIRGLFQVFTGANYTETGDITGNAPQAGWFVDASTANLHLTKLATAAIGQAVLLPGDVPTDFDGQARPVDAAADVGADEFVPADLDGNGGCDVTDLLTFVASFGLSAGQPGYDAKADFTGDNTVDVIDLLTFIDYFGL